MDSLMLKTEVCVCVCISICSSDNYWTSYVDLRVHSSRKKKKCTHAAVTLHSDSDHHQKAPHRHALHPPHGGYSRPQLHAANQEPRNTKLAGGVRYRLVYQIQNIPSVALPEKRGSDESWSVNMCANRDEVVEMVATLQPLCYWGGCPTKKNCPPTQM